MEPKFKKEDILHLSEELERQKNSKYDVVVSTENLIVLKDGDTIKMDVPVIREDNEVEGKQFGITDYCHSQIATKTGIPYRYYQKMQEEGKLDLLAQNINTWLPSKEKRLVRILDGKVRALLSDRYRVIDNYDILWKALESVSEVKKTYGIDVNIVDAKVTEQHLYIKAVSPQLTADIKKVTGLEPVVGGIIISNSEVGAGAVSIKPFIEVIVCTNGLISDKILKRIHTGRERDIGVIDWSDETLMHEDLALFGRIQDMIKYTFDPEIFKSWVDSINKVASVELNKPIIALDNVIKHFKIPEKKKESLLNQLFKEDKSQWGLAMAVTRCAQDEEDFEKRIELEHIGAQILELPMKVLTATATKEE
jgi:hypothetical protein